MTSSSLRIIVTGMAAQFPLGGVAWDYLQYILGLAGLGHDVYYYEDTSSWPYDPVQKQFISDGTYSANYLQNFFKQYAPELSPRWHYWHLRERSFGMDRSAFDEVARTADLFLNVSGACSIPENLSSRCIKVFLDTDPGYNQIMLSEKFAWSDNVQQWCSSVARHDQYFTYAENINGPDCLIPKVGFHWKTTRMPIVMKLWEPVAHTPPEKRAPWTTIMTWSAFRGKLIYKTVEYKSKGHELEKLIELPRRVNTALKIGMGGNAPTELLKSRGWNVVDGPGSTLSPQDYQKFIADSSGELSIAKHVYAAMRSGWFSCRSACYLAAGRPVVVQDTGFSKILPVGEGLISFTNVEEAAGAIQEIETDYKRHSKAALAYAREYFESGKVLNRLVQDIFSPEESTPTRHFRML